MSNNMKICQIQNNVLFYQFFVFIQMKEKECLECDRMDLSIETPEASKVCSRAFDLSCKWLVLFDQIHFPMSATFSLQTWSRT